MAELPKDDVFGGLGFFIYSRSNQRSTRRVQMINKWFIKGLLGRVVLLVRMLALAILVLVQAVPGFAKMYEEPRSFSLKDKSQEQVERKVLPKIDIERLLAEDRTRGNNTQRPGPHRFAVAADVVFTLDNSGTWQTLPDGRLWRLRIQSPGAKSLNLGITRFDMPEGVKLWIYDPGHKHVEGPYTARHRSRHGSLWTPVIEGDEIVVEVFVPAGDAQPVVEIRKVNQGYRGFKGLEKDVPGAGTEGACENDVICAVGDPWRNQIRAVGVYTINGTAHCTGTLMNDTAWDGTPYFLSAKHCGVSDSNDYTVVVYWNYESETCGTHGPGSTTDNQLGSTYRASYTASDFVLFELSDKPDPNFKVFYSGWDATGTPPPSTVGIHHPQCDVKAISFSNSSPDITTWASATHDPSGNYWYVLWDSGVMEAGSSGSCLFETTNKRCIGQLHGGWAKCGGTNLTDWYGRLSVSWTGDGADPATQLKPWLDNANSGVLVLDGDPHITTANGIHYDFQGAGEYFALRNASGLEIQARQAPITTTFNPGTDPHDGLATCVSLNTAVAARVGKHRVSYEPNLSGVPDPSGLQLRVDGVLTTLGPIGIDFGDGGRITKTSAPGGLEIDFPDNSVLFVTPGWWASQNKWYLNVDVVRTPSTAADGISGDRTMITASAGDRASSTGGLMYAIPQGSWLPALPDGSSMGPMPNSLHQRYVDLYQKFGDAWRVTDKTSLFDYAPGTSTDTFTMRNWPLENPPCVIPETKPVKPASKLVAQQACRAVTDKNAHNNCVFDVMVTGEPGFAKTYLASQRILAGSTKTTVTDDENPTQVGEWVTFTATVAALSSKGAPTGTVQFTLDGAKVGGPVKLDSNGRATWETSRLKVGNHRIAASYSPGKGSVFLASTSFEKLHTVRRCVCESTAEHK
jgi:hypothetical protein